MEKTLIILKPDSVQRGLVGEIISRFERAGLKMIAAKMVRVKKSLADQHYPKSRREFVAGMGQKTLNRYKSQGIEPLKHIGTDDPYKIGLVIQDWLVKSITESPVIAIVLEGPNAVELVRKICGQTFPIDAEPGTIRGDLSFDSPSLANEQKRPVRNLVHASGNLAEAKHEVNLWFTKAELHAYDTIHQKHMTS